MPKNFWQRAHKFSLKDQKRKKKIVDKQIIGIILWKPRPQVVTTLPQSLRWKVEIFSLNVRKRGKKPEQFCSWNWSYGQWEWRFDNIAESFWQSSHNFCSMPKSVQEKSFPVTKHIFVKRCLLTKERSFDNLAELLRQ